MNHNLPTEISTAVVSIVIEEQENFPIIRFWFIRLQWFLVCDNVLGSTDGNHDPLAISVFDGFQLHFSGNWTKKNSKNVVCSRQSCDLFI